MSRFRLFALPLVVVGLLFATPSDASWTKSESFEYSAKTSLKIVEPTDAKVFVTIGGETKEGTVPAIFALPDEDAFIGVKIVSADGDAWTGKIEVKAHKQTVTKFTHVANAVAPAAKPADNQKFIGQIQNMTHLCKKGERDTLKFVAMKDGKSAYETTVPPNTAQSNVELVPGTYSVRIFKNNVFFVSKELEVSKDGWVFTYGCK
jgi:hypothetical protein